MMTRQIDEITLYTVDEAADLLRLHPQTVRNYLKAGRLRGRKVGIKWTITSTAIREYLHETPETRQD